MSTTLDGALDNYENSVHSGSGGKAGLKANSHIKHRGKYPKPFEKPETDGSGCWYSEIVRVRGEWLVQNKPEIAKDWLARKNVYCLGALARKYVPDDYQVSPRVARMIVYHALERLVEKKELEGVDADDNFYYKGVDKLWKSNGKLMDSRNGQAGSNGKPRRKTKSGTKK